MWHIFYYYVLTLLYTPKPCFWLAGGCRAKIALSNDRVCQNLTVNARMIRVRLFPGLCETKSRNFGIGISGNVMCWKARFTTKIQAIRQCCCCGTCGVKGRFFNRQSNQIWSPIYWSEIKFDPRSHRQSSLFRFSTHFDAPISWLTICWWPIK